MEYKYIIAGALVCAGLGAALERKFAPQPKAIEVTKEVLRDRVVTVEHTIVRPDGTKIIDSTSTENKTDQKLDTRTTVGPLPAKYMLGGGYNTISGGYSAEVGYRVVGPVWVSLQATTNKELYIKALIEF